MTNCFNISYIVIGTMIKIKPKHRAKVRRILSKVHRMFYMWVIPADEWEQINKDIKKREVYTYVDMERYY